MASVNAAAMTSLAVNVVPWVAAYRAFNAATVAITSGRNLWVDHGSALGAVKAGALR